MRFLCHTHTPNLNASKLLDTTICQLLASMITHARKNPAKDSNKLMVNFLHSRHTLTDPNKPNQANRRKQSMQATCLLEWTDSSKCMAYPNSQTKLSHVLE